MAVVLPAVNVLVMEVAVFEIGLLYEACLKQQRYEAVDSRL
jgi:hypothetical protein